MAYLNKFKDERGNISGKGNLLIVFILLCVLIFLLIGGVYLMDVLGVVNKGKLFSMIPGIGKSISSKGGFEDVKIEEMRKLKESIEVQLVKLEEKKKALEKKEKEIKMKDAELSVLEETIQQKKIAVEERENRYNKQEEKWQRVVNILEGLNPKIAVGIMKGLDDETVIEIFRRMQASNVPKILKQMDVERASNIMRKMSR